MGCVWLWCSAYSLLRDSQYNKGLTNAFVIQLTLCCESVLAVMLTKTEVSAAASTLRSEEILLFLKSD